MQENGILIGNKKKKLNGNVHAMEKKGFIIFFHFGHFLGERQIILFFDLPFGSPAGLRP